MIYFLQAVAELGPVDMLVNSAGISHPGEFDVLTVDQFRVSMDLAFIFMLYMEDVKIIRMLEYLLL